MPGPVISPIGSGSRITTDESLHLDNNILRANISDFDNEFVWEQGRPQLFELSFEPTYVASILVNGIELSSEQYHFRAPKGIEIMDPLQDGDLVKIRYQHYNFLP